MKYLPGYLPGKIHLITGPRAYTYEIFDHLLVQQALVGPLQVLVTDNRFPLYEIAYALAGQSAEYWHILETRISLARAETCYQVLALLAKTEASPVFTLVSGLLTTFYEQSVPEAEIDELLFESTLELRRLSRGAPLVVSAHLSAERPRLLKALVSVADKIQQPHQGKPLTAAQMRLL